MAMSDIEKRIKRKIEMLDAPSGGGGPTMSEKTLFTEALETIQQLRDAIDEAMAVADRSYDHDCCYVSEILTKALQEQGQ
jgi:hypothetical protein